MTMPRRPARVIECQDPPCGKGTCHGLAALTSKYGFAPCMLDRGHGGRCNSGDGPPDPEPITLPEAA
jgi:hypothetical protein